MCLPLLALSHGGGDQRTGDGVVTGHGNVARLYLKQRLDNDRD